ncbi:hypothetical protein SAY87_019585 [Trapa incisa]|uniref:FLZ-type domain-containing protein n=1 Tax=Trapa incisa TaxID=236973 RepID=A0AAN7Q355_9MYRT|nr:hypothetical protein SAY87_019585 [Trapa incisa]
MDSARRPLFTADVEDDDDRPCQSMETGVSSNSTAIVHLYSFSSRTRKMLYYSRPRYEEPQPPPHFLESCALCKKRLGNRRDIFMYRGDTAFCSQDCRQEQIDLDETKQKNRNLSSLRKQDQRQASTTSPSKSQGCPLRTRTVAAA